MGASGIKTDNGKSIEAGFAIDSAEAAEEAGLQYVSDDRRGYTRREKDGDFEYLDTQGKRIQASRHSASMGGRLDFSVFNRTHSGDWA